MTTFAVIDAKARHCGQMSRILRHEHQVALMRLGVSTHRQIRLTYDQSYFRKAWLIDGQLAALGGVVGSELSPFGFIWLTLSTRAARYPLEIVREARRQIAEIMVTKDELQTTVVEGDEAALRLAIFLGFHVGHDWRGSPAISLHGRRRLTNHLKSTPELLEPLGDWHAYRMGYHPAEMS